MRTARNYRIETETMTDMTHPLPHPNPTGRPPSRTLARSTALAALLLGAAACGSEEPGRLPPPTTPADVTVTEAWSTSGSNLFPAQVRSRRTAEIATRIAGTVARVHVDAGSRVREGEALLTLDSADLQAALDAARTAREVAERAYRRLERLAADGAASAQELDQAEAALEAARAREAAARAQMAYAVVRAPFSGVVTARTVDEGDLATPGRPLLTLVAPTELEVVADLPAARYGSVETGDVLEVYTTGGGRAEARVTRVVPALGAASRTFRVEARLDAGAGEASSLLPGSFVRVRVGRPGTESGASPSLWIPADAVVRRGQLSGVFALEGDTLRLRWVRLGRRDGDAVELLGAPAPTLTVVRRPAAELTDGTPVGSVRRKPWDGHEMGEVRP